MAELSEPLLGAAKKGLGCCAGACSGFRDFILRGDVVSLAVAVVVGNSFTALVDAFVRDWLTPLIAIFFKGTGEFSKQTFEVRGSVFKYGDFTNVAITFLCNCLVVYFCVVLPMNALVERSKASSNAKEEPAPPSDSRECPECMSEIPAAAKRCKFCTATVTPLPPPQVVTQS